MPDVLRVAGSARRMAPLTQLTGESNPGEDSLVLIEWRSNFYQEDLDKLLSSNATIVANFPDDVGPAPHPACFVGNVEKGLAYCCCQKNYDPPTTTSCLNRILDGEPPFPSIHLQTVLSGRKIGRPKSIFLARPSAPELSDDFRDAARTALKKLNIPFRDPLEEPGGQVNRNVREAIDACDTVFANLRQKELIRKKNGESVYSYNPNVMFEIGYAAKADKALLLFGHPDDRLDRPSDIQDWVVEPVRDSIELVQRVYYGFCDATK